ncbi:ABC transporter substrate-binding protein [Rhodopseudomonas palustris]|uniref:ABC transporter substrate-binding protein n=2 Tax=Rhodopseudomonas palustris TaxID=1076 RepID=A0A418VRC4_RHOPL|nr:ABC transporter substrate-binding protein [Rhodopseudomonas palustris]
MTPRSSVLAVAMASASMTLVSMTAMAQDKPPVKIGFVTELTGPWSFFGTSCVAGLKLAEKNLNPPGKRKIEFVIADDQTSPAQAVAASRSLDVQDKVLALSGPTSSDTGLAVYGYAEQNKVPFVVPVAAFPQLTKPGTRYTFRLEPDAVGWGYAISKFVEKQKPGGKIAMIYSDYALMRAITAGIKYQAPRSGLSIVADIAFPQGSSDATVQAAQILAAKPDFVVVSGAGGFDNTITNQLLDLGVKPEQIIHPFGITTQVINWGKRSVGSYYGTFFDSNLDSLTPEGKTFVSDFIAQNDRPPSYGENFCYVTANVIREAIDKNPEAADDREKFRDAMSALKTKETTSGVPIEFDKNGARMEYMYFMQISDVAPKTYKAKQSFYIEWDPEVIPVYTLVK